MATMDTARSFSAMSVAGIIVFFLALKISSHVNFFWDSQNFLFLAPKIEKNWNLKNFLKFQKITYFEGSKTFFFNLQKVKSENFLKFSENHLSREFEDVFFLSPKSKIWKFPQNFLKFFLNISSFWHIFRKFHLFFVYKVYAKKTIAGVMDLNKEFSAGWFGSRFGVHQIDFKTRYTSRR